MRPDAGYALLELAPDADAAAGAGAGAGRAGAARVHFCALPQEHAVLAVSPPPSYSSPYRVSYGSLNPPPLLFPLPRVLREPEPPPPPSYCSPYRVSYGSLNPPPPTVPPTACPTGA